MDEFVMTAGDPVEATRRIDAEMSKQATATAYSGKPQAMQIVRACLIDALFASRALTGKATTTAEDVTMLDFFERKLTGGLQ